jgi:hypothetical protein
MENPVKDIGLISGTNIDVVSKFNIATGFDWIDPPISPLLGTYFPMEATYHPLLNHSDYEIATNILSIHGATDLSEDKKKEYTEKVADIIKDSYYLQNYCSVNICYIILLVIGLILLISGADIWILGGLFVGILLFTAFTQLILFPYSKSRGISKWNEFSRDFGAKLRAAGDTPKSVLESYKSDKFREEDIQARYNSAGLGNNVTMSTTSGLVAGVSAGIISSILSHR